MKNGIDSRAFAEAIKAADPAERKRLWGEYSDWIARGAREQGALWMSLGALLILLPLGAAIYFWPLPNPWIWALLVAPILVGARIMMLGFRRERAWREANPFRW